MDEAIGSMSELPMDEAIGSMSGSIVVQHRPLHGFPKRD